MLGKKGDRHEDRHQHCRRSDHGKEHLACTNNSGRAGPHAIAMLSLNILEDDDGVIHDQSGREHQRKQRQDVDGETKQPDGGDGADQ